MFNVHALGGYDMMKAAAEAAELEAEKLGRSRPKILAVTVLTSMDEMALNKIGIDANIKDEVLRLAHLAKTAGHYCGVRVVKTERIAQIAVRPVSRTSEADAAGARSIRPDGRPYLITNRRTM